MKLIKELSDIERQKLVGLLEADGFSAVKDQGSSISFKQGIREFELLSSDIDNEDDLGLRIELDFEGFLSANYHEKTRHSVSLREATNAAEGSQEGGCELLGWEIQQVKNLETSKSSWRAEMHASQIIEVLVGEKVPHMHIIVDGKVFEGSIDKLWSVGSVSPQEIMKDTNTLAFLIKLNSSAV